MVYQCSCRLVEKFPINCVIYCSKKRLPKNCQMRTSKPAFWRKQSGKRVKGKEALYINGVERHIIDDSGYSNIHS